MKCQIFSKQNEVSDYCNFASVILVYSHYIKKKLQNKETFKNNLKFNMTFPKKEIFLNFGELHMKFEVIFKYL